MSKRILVVDDEESMRKVIADSLEREYDVVCASNGKEACALIDEERYDLVITDLVMPEMNGIDLVMKLRESDPDQKIIAISGGGGIKGRFDYLPVAQLIGACSILSKPFQVKDLRETVHQLLSELR